MSGSPLVAQLRELLAKAKPDLPWDVFDGPHFPWTDALSIGPHEYKHVAHTTRGSEANPETGEGGPSWNAARLIVGAVNALPALLDALERAEAVIAAADAMRSWAGGCCNDVDVVKAYDTARAAMGERAGE